MKLAVLYFSVSGRTAACAEAVARGAQKAGAEVCVCDLDHAADACLDEAQAVVFGTPTYFANTCWQVKKWFDESHALSLEGKLGAVFSTADYAQGGPGIAELTVLEHMLVKGMLVYSGGSALGKPYLHIGAVSLKGHEDEGLALCEALGERVARKGLELFKKR
ncbi:MAG: flavodoxin family protein [Oscillospiraceae bacterium]|nr:flavodoxin family protein [Oscillospiraceae bacterium]